MSITPEERNIKAKQYVEDLYSNISHLTIDDFSSHPLFEQADSILQNVVHAKITAKGFRGIVLTAIVGKHLNSSYDFLNKFYDCSPRAIFENGIFLALRDLKIPCGKSDPLNVAKNTNVLSMEWAEGKRPQRAAEAVVNYLKLLDKNFSQTEDYSFLINLFMFRLKELADIHAQSTVSVGIVDIASSQELALNLWKFISTAVEGGTIPQFFIGILLEAIYLHDQKVIVEGTRESVSGTNTTSKKPGDLVLLRDRKAFSILEVTLKKIDNKRLSDSYDVLHALNHLDTPITFICRIPEDTQALKEIANLNKSSGFIKNPHTFNFIDIQSFICSQITLLDAVQLEYLLAQLRTFINAYDRPINTRNIWNECFPETPSDI
ncbi:hypothetical protein P255_02857 [Acinetobacter brisouii CIP 110357]|uniref:Uncharacterized protein n=1 Tax=Acinetobacter brisouii CIP 110357 TaxID=1341683 RepID=V2VKS8_9GAMM|nr:restriction endonuclease, SacI family [Acinetobacter brisouii]ENV48799.1 hypothetical protein F954_00189 [Acinetobacter brisouii ANC 4119]ESK48214.1 hypothetical protein P255_02857 [Acinetobacter brisouii CIP 110357]